MKYLKYFNESKEELQSNINIINDVLIELVDDDWVVFTTYTPIRWGNPTYHIPNDYITITIKRNRNKSQSKYPPGSDFFYNEIKDYVDRLIEVFKGSEMSYKFMVHDEEHDSQTSYMPDHKTGVQTDRYELTTNVDNTEILAFIMKIELVGENLDNFKHHELYGIAK